MACLYKIYWGRNITNELDNHNENWIYEKENHQYRPKWASDIEQTHDENSGMVPVDVFPDGDFSNETGTVDSLSDNSEESASLNN